MYFLVRQIEFLIFWINDILRKATQKTKTLPHIVWATNRARQTSSDDAILFLDAFTKTRKQLAYEITIDNNEEEKARVVRTF